MNGDLRLYPAEDGICGPSYTVVARDEAHARALLDEIDVPNGDPELDGPLEIGEPYADDAPFTCTSRDESMDEVRAQAQPEGAVIATDPNGYPTVTATAKAWCDLLGPGVFTCSDF